MSSMWLAWKAPSISPMLLSIRSGTGMGMAGIGEVSSGGFFFFFCAAAADEKKRMMIRAVKQRTQALAGIMRLCLLTVTKNSTMNAGQRRVWVACWRIWNRAVVGLRPSV